MIKHKSEQIVGVKTKENAGLLKIGSLNNTANNTPESNLKSPSIKKRRKITDIQMCLVTQLKEFPMSTYALSKRCSCTIKTTQRNLVKLHKLEVVEALKLEDNPALYWKVKPK